MDIVLTGSTKEGFSADNKEVSTDDNAEMKQYKQALARKLMIRKKSYESVSDIENQKDKQIDAAGSPQGVILM